MKKSSVEWFNQQLVDRQNGNGDSRSRDEIFEQAKEMEVNVATEYAEFCIRCDRAGLRLVKFEDWKKEINLKSEPNIILCGEFIQNPTTSSTKCICGRYEWEHPIKSK